MSIWDRFRAWLVRDLIAEKDGRLMDMAASRDRGLDRLRGAESKDHLTLGLLVENDLIEQRNGPFLAYLRDADGRTCLIELPDDCRGMMIGSNTPGLDQVRAMQNAYLGSRGMAALRWVQGQAQSGGGYLGYGGHGP